MNAQYANEEKVLAMFAAERPMQRADFILLAGAVRGKRLARDEYKAKLARLVNQFPRSITFHGLGR